MPEWVWDADAMRYRYSSGRIVPQKYVKNDIRRLAYGVRGDLREITRLLNAGDISPEQWYKRMKVEIRLSYRAAFVAAEGGLQNMNASKWGRFGALMKKEYRFLDRFYTDIKSGKWRGGRAIGRSGLYGNAITRFYENWRLHLHKLTGYTEGRRVLSPAEHCTSNKGLEGCVELSNLGWVMIDEVVPIGDTPCHSNCHCSIEYRRQMKI